MIKIELTLAITGYLFLSLLILFFWMVTEARKKTGFPFKKDEFLWECPLCFHIYIDSSGNEISKCPVCGCLSKRGEKGYNITRENLPNSKEAG
ncbi:MAG: hypothetical protein NC825_00240 [Candidatus Omnitrophica bacterium]|jgi:hypothetical protein|nr:hypothetical protein [Candidatus Omnitrophota bacterium]